MGFFVPNSNFNFENQPQNGPSITSIYVTRKVKVFAVHEQELDQLSTFNDFSVVMFSAATFFLSLAARNGFHKFKFESEFWICLALYIVGAFFLFSKKNLLTKIKDQSP